ncbi:hypothetical protein I350_07651 [Cryptococcus amylolentus CBS 6273]|uniref:Uncharacterized protein n=1 Tax=Cryptococcus amylolentus CBS 6273 TaxID=1296118 RepID=A0A1E3JAW0_9TREE|nr:hypothetical protein I350_07651 [Cryptococcus amylolentus CBS 6273]
MSKPASKAAPQKPYGRPQKVVNKTVDLLKKNERASAAGKGKERQVLGDVMGLVDEVKRLPNLIQVEKFAQTRAMEIHAFQTAIKSAATQGNTRAFQSLPRHLRRRAASHNPRRVPKRLRSRAAAEIDAADNIAKKHRKIAKLRAKGTLRSHLSRTALFRIRQRSKRWLPTHIWHAKRHHMVNHWGWRLPMSPTLKSFRPAYRAGRRKAVAWDVSYYGVIEMEGRREDIVRLLGGVTDGKFAGDMFESGARVAGISFYQYDAFPQGLIGPGEVIWQPITHAKNDRKVWIRLHPSIFNHVWTLFKTTSLHILSEAGSSSNASQGLQIRDLRDQLEALEIMGPKSGEVLRRVLRLCKSEESLKQRVSLLVFNGLQDPSNIPDGTVIGLQAYDPRLHFPPPKLSEAEQSGTNDGVLRDDIIGPTGKLAFSLLWDAESRENASEVTHTKFQLDARRHKLGLPGTRLHPGQSDDRLPIMLFKRSTHPPPSTTPQSFHGFTLLLPTAWAQYLLTSIAYTGTLIGGLNERKVQHREAGVHSFPEYFSGVCEAGDRWHEGKAAFEKETWDRKPPGKRVEFAKVGTSSPWTPDWDKLLGADTSAEEASLNTSSPCKPYLLPHPFSTYISPSLDPLQLLEQLNTFRRQRSLAALPPTKTEALFNEAVLHVDIDVLGRGSPGDMAMICGLVGEKREKWIQAYEREDDGFNFAGEVTELQKLGQAPSSHQRLIGYTDSGNISLTRGQGHALGTITLRGYVELLQASYPSAAGQIGHVEGWDGKALVCVKNRDGTVGRFGEVRVCG